MKQAEAQHNHIHNQPTQRQVKGALLESPQGEQIAQLEAMAEASPQAGKLAQLAAAANNSPQASAQRRMMDMVHNSPRMTAQRKAISAIHSSPNVVAQRQQLGSLTGEAVQCEEAEEPLQPEVTQREAAPQKPNNTGLPNNLKSGIESLSGMSMDNVRVHYNSPQPAQLNALAYAQGTDIHVAPGQEQHLPHEAWHVVQQAQGRVRPTMQMKEGVPVEGGMGTEGEKNRIGVEERRGVGIAQLTKGKKQSKKKTKKPTTASKKKKTTTGNKTKGKKGKKGKAATSKTATAGKHKATPATKKATKVKPGDPIKKKHLTVKNTTDKYSTNWMRSITPPQGVDAAPRAEAQKLQYILGDTPCVGGHMVNDQMGGDGSFSNIIPITKSMNTCHTAVENAITKTLPAGYDHAKLEMKYTMLVSGRTTKNTSWGTVDNWPTTYTNCYYARDKNTHVAVDIHHAKTKSGEENKVSQGMVHPFSAT